MIEIIAFIAEFRRITQNEETVRKAIRNQQLLFVFRRKLRPVPFSEGLALCTEIDRNIKHTAADCSDQLRLRKLLLKMQPSEHTFRRTGLIVLHKPDADACFFHVLLRVGLHEITPFVTVNSQCNDAKPLNAADVLFNCDLSHFPVSPVNSVKVHPAMQEAA